MKYIQNIECGNIFPATAEGLCEAFNEACELYDLLDPTNGLYFGDLYCFIEG